MSFSHEKIKARAYGLYLERNGKGGSQLEDWLKAEKEVEKGNPKPDRPLERKVIRKDHFLREI